MKRIQLPLVLFILLLSLSACSQNIARGDSSVVAENVPTPQPVTKTLSSFNPIQGTDYLMAGIVPVSTATTRDASFNPLDWISNSGYSSGYTSYAIYNYVFFNTETKSYLRLLQNNEYVIYQTTGFPQPTYDPSHPDQPAPVIEYWVYTIVKADTNKDGGLGYLDKYTIGISDVGGNGYTELIENADAILSIYYENSASLLVIYNVNEKNFIAVIDPSTRQLVSTIEMDLGEDVQ